MSIATTTPATATPFSASGQRSEKNSAWRYAVKKGTSWLALLAVSAWATAARADGLATLDEYLKTARSGEAAFTQTVTNVNKPGAAKTSKGQFAFKRPQQFRFDYRAPFAQTIVADGKNLWMFDVDLNQVTQHPQAEALNATPAALVAASTNIQMLQKQFKLENVPAKDKLEWVKATPLKGDAQIKDIMIGFAGKQLRKLEILDSFGQRSVMEFEAFGALTAPNRFQFTPPTGADIIKR